MHAPKSSECARTLRIVVHSIALEPWWCHDEKITTCLHRQILTYPLQMVESSRAANGRKRQVVDARELSEPVLLRFTALKSGAGHASL